MGPFRTLIALLAVLLTLAACGDQTHGSATASARQAKRSLTVATPSRTTPSPANAIAKINDAFKHLTPEQLAAIKARMPAYLHALQACAKAADAAQAATLACLRSHGFGATAP